MTPLNLIHLVISAVALIVLLSVSKESLRRIGKIIDVLTLGSYVDCPHCKPLLEERAKKEE